MSYAAGAAYAHRLASRTRRPGRHRLVRIRTSTCQWRAALPEGEPRIRQGAGPPRYPGLAADAIRAVDDGRPDALGRATDFSGMPPAPAAGMPPAPGRTQGATGGRYSVH